MPGGGFNYIDKEFLLHLIFIERRGLMASIETIINRQIGRWEMERRLKTEAERERGKASVRLIVTISRQRGSRGSYLAERLAERLDYQLLHREIIDEVCNSSGYRRQVIESLDDKARSNIELWFDGMIKRQYVDASGYFRHLLKVIRSFAEYSGVVVVGRGANYILGSRQGYHIRVVAENDTRIENLMKYQSLSREQATQETKDSDRERADFIKSNFKRDIDDPGGYDLIINSTYTDIVRALEMVQLGINAKTDFINMTT